MREETRINLLRSHRTPGRKSLLSAAAAVLLALLLSGCAGTQAEPEPVEETPAPVYALHYYLGDKLLQTQTLAQGQYPAHLELTFPGLHFAGWRDGAGAAAQPEQTAIEGDVDYYAVIYPILENHVPFLFADDDGFLHPDAPLTNRDLTAAMRALASPEAAAYLPALPDTDEPLQADAFRETLRKLFPAQRVDEAAGDLAADAQIARHEAAAVFNKLLGRDGAEKITLRRDAFLAPDVLQGTADYADLLEASVSHAVDAWGETWDACEIPGCYAPGFLPIHGKLYCIGDDGTILTDTQVDGFTFGPDGVYTSGSAELDGYVLDILARIDAAHPYAEPLELLRAAFEYARDSFTYFRKPALTFGATGWEIECAVDMLGSGRGNCYDYAAVFWALARGLGYDAKAYSGTISEQPHGWVEIMIDDVNYLFDPELEMAARARGQMNTNRFMMTKQAASYYGFYFRL